jgi:hypothetical protein
MTRRINRPPTPISKKSAESISEVRRAQISDAANKSMDLQENSTISGSIAHSPGFRKKSLELLKRGSIASPMPGPTTSATSDRMSPEIYSPLFQLANLNLPRDRVTMNAWNRVFYDTHPIVRNAINLHASYPISKINITCKNKKVQQFFMEMAEKIDLYSVVYGAALEFWKMGEAFPYAELDENLGTWSRITILNPDYAHVKKTVIGNHTMVSLRPDATLQRLVNSTAPSDLSMRKFIPKHILNYVRRGQNIPLDAFNVSHLKLLSSPYDVRGTSIIVSIYKDLMLYDKLRESKFAQADGMINPLTLVTLGGEGDYRPTQADIEAFKNLLEEAQYDKDFKIVTHNGVKVERAGFSGSTLEIGTDIEHIVTNLYAGLMTPKALMDQESACLKVSDNEVLTESGGWKFFDDLSKEDKIATVNPDTKALEFHKPTFYKDYEFSGMMYKFKNQEVDVEVTDFHEMFISKDNGANFEKKRALEVFDIDEINSDVPFSSKHKKNVRFMTTINSWAGNDAPDFISVPHKGQYTGIESTVDVPIDDWLEFIGYYLSEGHLRRRNDKSRGKKHMSPCGVDVTQQTDGKGFAKMSELFARFAYDSNITGEKSRRRSWNISNTMLAEYVLAHYGEKSAGKFIPQWMKQLSRDKLEILLNAMILGDGHILKNSGSGSTTYATTSKQLADDVQEIAFKCGYAAKASWYTKAANGKVYDPICRITILKNAMSKRGPIRKSKPLVKPTDVKINWVNKERVFCVEVPNHVFVTRSNGKIAIHGNTYASSSVGLEVLRQRYDIFRNMIKKWLERKIFAPICEIQDFFEYVDGEKRLLVPSIDFNHMNLYDMADFITSVGQFVGNQQVSLQTLHRSLGLSYEEERRRIREEMIDNQIFAKEQQALGNMKLNELLSLDPSKSITEPPGAAAGAPPEGGLPGVGMEGGMEGGMPDLGGGMPDLGGGGPPEGGAI